MFRKLDQKEKEIANSIQRIQRLAYRIEAGMMDFDGIPQLHETLHELQYCDEVFWGYYEEGELLGFLSYKRERDIIDIHRLAVDPANFRKGVARRLLTFLVETFKDMDIIVSTGKANEPAKKLYDKFGFIETEDFEVAPYIYCTRLERKRANSEMGEY